jgi:hypothetical protein
MHSALLRRSHQVFGIALAALTPSQEGVRQPNGHVDLPQAAGRAAAQLRGSCPQHHWPQRSESALYALPDVAGQPAAALVLDHRQQAAAQAGGCSRVRCCEALHTASQFDGSSYVGDAPCNKHHHMNCSCVQCLAAAQQLGQPYQVLCGTRLTALASLAVRMLASMERSLQSTPQCHASTAKHIEQRARLTVWKSVDQEHFVRCEQTHAADQPRSRGLLSRMGSTSRTMAASLHVETPH